MRTFVFLAFLFVAAFVVMTTALPTDGDVEELKTDGRGSRQKRVPCQFLSGIGWDNNHCMNYCSQTSKPIGYCNNGVCVCLEPSIGPHK